VGHHGSSPSDNSAKGSFDEAQGVHDYEELELVQRSRRKWCQVGDTVPSNQG
jgi:hypothetical protein